MVICSAQGVRAAVAARIQNTVEISTKGVAATYIVGVGELAEALQQERYPGLEARQDVVPKVEPLL